jgi:S1-C subfamily serine protease
MLTRRALVAAAAFTGAAARAQSAPSTQSGLPALIEHARASVVPVGTYNPTDSPRFGFRGSGFAVGDGSVVATNFHVLPAGSEAEAGPRVAVLHLPQRGAAPELRLARVTATDRARDLALLKIDGTPLPPLALAEPDAAREGQAVALMGFPIGGVLGYSMVTHRGIVSALTTAALPAASAGSLDPRAITRLREGNFELLQLDATAYPGNSGGPLLDEASGRVVGVINMVLVKAGRESALSAPTGITYAVPVRALQALMTEAKFPPPR